MAIRGLNWEAYIVCGPAMIGQRYIGLNGITRYEDLLEPVFLASYCYGYGVFPISRFGPRLMLPPHRWCTLAHAVCPSLGSE
jgi:hypothetical protein